MTSRDRALGRGIWPAPATHPHRRIGRAALLLITGAACFCLGAGVALAVIIHAIEHGRLG